MKMMDRSESEHKTQLDVMKSSEEYWKKSVSECTDELNTTLRERRQLIKNNALL